MVRQELRAAVQVCPRLAALVGDHILADPASAGPSDIARIAVAAETWLPEIERNNALSVSWGWARHGPRVIAMLAIALEDPAVQNPCKYFGWMVTRSAQGAPDLRLNLARIMRVKGTIPDPDAPPPPLMEAPGSEDPKWQAIDGALRKIVREGAYGSWFGRVGFHGLTDGLLTLSTPNQVVGPRLASEDMVDDRRPLGDELMILLLGQDDGRRLAAHADVLRPFVDRSPDDLAEARLGVLQLPDRVVAGLCGLGAH